MKRLWITLLVIAMTAIITLPAGAGAPNFCDEENFPDDYKPGHPSCTTTTTTTTTTEPATEEACEFVDGKLAGYTGTESAPYKCEWTITDAEHWEYSFVLKAASGTPLSVLRPHLFVTDAYPIGDKCFDQVDNGWHALPYTFGPFTPPAEDVSCDSPTYNITDADTDDPDNVYSLIIAARAKGAPLELWLVKS